MPDDLLPIQYLKDYYQSCVARDIVEEKGLAPFDPHVSRNHKFGGWPMIQERWDDDKYNFELAEGGNKREYGLDTLITIESTLNPYNTSESIFVVSLYFLPGR